MINPTYKCLISIFFKKPFADMRAEIRMSSTGWTFCHEFPSWRAYQLPPHQRISTSSPLLIALCSLKLLHEGCVTRISQTGRTQAVIVAGPRASQPATHLQVDASPHSREEEPHPTLIPRLLRCHPCQTGFACAPLFSVSAISTR